jgi:hypothetical protein
MSGTWQAAAVCLDTWKERVQHHRWQQKEHGSWWGGAYDSRKVADAARLEKLADRVWECHAGNQAKGARCSLILDEYNALWQRYLTRV